MGRMYALIDGVTVFLTPDELDALLPLFESVTECAHADALLSVAVKITEAIAGQIESLN